MCDRFLFFCYLWNRNQVKNKHRRKQGSITRTSSKRMKIIRVKKMEKERRRKRLQATYVHQTVQHQSYLYYLAPPRWLWPPHCPLCWHTELCRTLVALEFHLWGTSNALAVLALWGSTVHSNSLTQHSKEFFCEHLQEGTFILKNLSISCLSLH